MWPYWFADFNATTLGMGNVTLFTSGPSAVFFAPANLDTSFVLYGSGFHESRNKNGWWSDDDVTRLPHALGLTIPRVGSGSVSILLMDLMNWSGHDVVGDDTITGDAHLRNLSLGYCFRIHPKLNSGIAINYAWGSTVYLFQPFQYPIADEFSTYGLGLRFALSFLPKSNSEFAFHLIAPTLLRGDEVYSDSSTHFTEIRKIKDNLPWGIEGGVQHSFVKQLSIVTQVTYRNWRRGSGGFIWGDHEWRLHGGLAFKPWKVVSLRIGCFLQQFDSDLAIPFVRFHPNERVRALFITGGIGVKGDFIDVDLGVGKSVSTAYGALVDFFPERSLVAMSISVLPERLFKKQQ